MIREKENMQHEWGKGEMELHNNNCDNKIIVDLEEKTEENNESNSVEVSEAEERTKSSKGYFDRTRVEPSKSTSSARVSSLPGALTVVSSEQNGNKRISYAQSVGQKLKYPTRVQIGFTEDSMVISEKIPGCDNYFNVKSNCKKGIIYSSQLVSEIIELFNLDFNGITSKTFGEVQFYDGGEHPVAVIKIKE